MTVYEPPTVTRCDQSRAIIAFTTGPDTEDFHIFTGRIINMLC
jgi:hypothetical protein